MLSLWLKHASSEVGGTGKPARVAKTIHPEGRDDGATGVVHGLWT